MHCKARDQKTRLESDEIDQEPNEEKTGSKGQILNMGDVTEIYNDHSDVEVKDKKEERKISRFLA